MESNIFKIMNKDGLCIMTVDEFGNVTFYPNGVQGEK